MELAVVLHESVGAGLILLACLITISAVDDLVVDILVLASRKEAHSARGMGPRLRPKTQVLIANWHEADILEKMIEGNLRAIHYRPLKFVLGVYPNDCETIAAAFRLEKKFRGLVRVVVNPRQGPTSKGQMLNVMLSKVFQAKKSAPQLAVIHDAEDIIDPLSFYQFARLAQKFDFVQIPVFSLDSRERSWVGAHYMEEFAERHTREMRVRGSLGAMIPSAGVGTCMTGRVVKHFLAKRGFVFAPDCVTEDYVLGAEVHQDGFRSCFAYTSFGRPFIATREFFPKDFWAAVRQKARWTFGIAFQATRRLGWFGGFWDRFFTYRDRKGAVTNMLPPLALIVGGAAGVLGAWPDYVFTLSLFNTGLTAVRYSVKTMAVREVYGCSDALGIICRWPVTILINFLAACYAWKHFFDSRFATRSIGWAKTQHELPQEFVATRSVGPTRRRMLTARGAEESDLSYA